MPRAEDSQHSQGSVRPVPSALQQGGVGKRAYHLRRADGRAAARSARTARTKRLAMPATHPAAATSTASTRIRSVGRTAAARLPPAFASGATLRRSAAWLVRASGLESRARHLGSAWLARDGLGACVRRHAPRASIARAHLRERSRIRWQAREGFPSWKRGCGVAGADVAVAAAGASARLHYRLGAPRRRSGSVGLGPAGLHACEAAGGRRHGPSPCVRRGCSTAPAGEDGVWVGVAEARQRARLRRALVVAAHSRATGARLGRAVAAVVPTRVRRPRLHRLRLRLHHGSARACVLASVRCHQTAVTAGMLRHGRTIAATRYAQGTPDVLTPRILCHEATIAASIRGNPPGFCAPMTLVKHPMSTP